MNAWLAAGNVVVVVARAAVARPIHCLGRFCIAPNCSLDYE